MITTLLGFCLLLGTQDSASAGLVGHWALEEGSGTTTDDAAYPDGDPGEHDGTLQPAASGGTGPTWVTTDLALVPAAVGGTTAALEFDGSEDHVLTDYPGIGGSGPLAVSFWIKTTSTAGGGIVAWGDDTQNGGKYHVRLNDGAGGGTIRSESQGGNRIGSTYLANGQWHHVVSVLTGPNNDLVQHWIDGKAERTSAGRSQAIDIDIDDTDGDTREEPVSIGSRRQGARVYFEGQIDDVRIYDHVLSTSEVSALAGSIASHDAYEAEVVADNPVGYWRLNESDNTEAALSEGAAGGVDGTYEGGVTVGQSSLLPSVSGNTAARFDATQQQAVAVPNHLLINEPLAAPNDGVAAYPQRTIELWFNADDTTGRQVIYEQGGGSNGFNLYVEDGELVIGAWKTSNDGPDFGTKFASAPVTAGQDHHAVLVLDDATDQFTGYLDGSAVGRFTGISGVDNHSGAIGIGGMREDSRFVDGTADGDGYEFTGTIDEVAVYNAGLSLADVRRHFTAAGRALGGYDQSTLADDPIAYWQLGSSAAQKAVNVADVDTTAGSGLGSAVDGDYSGTLPRAAAPLVPGSLNSAQDFDGVGDYVGIPDSEAINTGSSTPLRTIELWFNADNATDRQVLFEEGGALNGMSVYLEEGQLRAGTWNSGSGAQTEFLGAPISAGGTHHLALSFDADDEEGAGVSSMVLYLDGKPVGTLTGVNPVNYHGGDVAIGGMRGDSGFLSASGDFEAGAGNGYYFDGRIDDVSLFNADNEAGQIRSRLAAVGIDATDPSQDAQLADDPLALWSMNEFDVQGAANIASDGAGLGHTLNLTRTDVDGGIQRVRGLTGGTDGAFSFEGGRLEAADLPVTRDTIEERSIELTFSADTIGTADETSRHMLYAEGGSTRGLNVYLQRDGATNDLELFLNGWNNANDDGAGNAAPWGAAWLSTPIEEQRPYQVQLVMDGADDGTGELRGYLNGRLFGTVDGVGLLYGHNPITLGGVNGNTEFAGVGDADGDFLFDGIIDDAALYGWALTDLDVAEHFAATGIPEPSTLLLLGLGLLFTLPARGRRRA
jgi:hypothetical protein